MAYLPKPGGKLRPRNDARDLTPLTENGPKTPILLEFESPTAALLALPVPVRSRYTTWVVSSIFFVVLTLMWTVPIDRVVSGTGKVVATAPNVVVQPLETSIVRSIDVHEGELVHKGQVLAGLDPTFAAADAGSLEGQAASLQAEVTRLQAESDNRPYVSDGTEAGQLQALIYAQRHAEYTFKIENYRQKIDALRVKVAQAQSDIKSYSDRLGLARSVEDKRQELQRLGVGSQLNALAATDSRVEINRGLETSKASLSSAQRDLDALIAERDGYEQQSHADTSQQRTEQGRKLSQAEEDLKKAKLRRNLVRLVADRDAIVLTVAPVSVGSVMQSGDQFITMVPTDSPLEIETVVDGRDAGFVHVGDEVTIKFDTFPYFTYGTARGTVRYLSPDSFHRPMEDRERVGKPRAEEAVGSLFYRARISLDEMKLHNLPAGFRVTPGMPVSADVKIGKRTMITYLLSRIIPPVTEGMREP